MTPSSFRLSPLRSPFHYYAFALFHIHIFHYFRRFTPLLPLFHAIICHDISITPLMPADDDAAFVIIFFID
jgi:hypothetical protein